jgi:acetolactate synthase-1/2/3 large subunit
MDIEGLARTFSGWERISGAVSGVSKDTAAAIQSAMGGRIATLIVPHDIQLSAFPAGPLSAPGNPYTSPEDDHIALAAKCLLDGRKTAIILDGRALSRKGLLAASRIRQAVGCDLISVAFPACMERGDNLPILPRIPYYPENASALLCVYDTVILADAHEPVSFFGYPGQKGRFLDETPTHMNLISEGQDVVEALERLAGHLPRASEKERREPGAGSGLPDMRSGMLTPGKFCVAVAHLQPENAIIVDEGTTSTSAYYAVAAGSNPHPYITLTGGAIGMGMPCATGAAIAAPERPVISLQSDGSAMYTLQALWTQARERLNITTLLCANRKYRILQEELKRAGYAGVGEKAQSMTDLGSPPVDWVKVSEGLGVPAVSVNTTEGLVEALNRALAEEGPHLIEMEL